MLCLFSVQDHLTALMEVNEENETLVKQHDREKQKRKEIEEVSTKHEIHVWMCFPITKSFPECAHVLLIVEM